MSRPCSPRWSGWSTASASTARTPTPRATCSSTCCARSSRRASWASSGPRATSSAPSWPWSTRGMARRHLVARIGPGGAEGPSRVGEQPLHGPGMPAMPFKANAARRHHIPKQRHRVTNWAEYDDALRQRGSLTVWFTEAAVAAWRAEPRATRGGQPWYSPLAILTGLTLRAVFRLALRQTEGLIGSILRLLGLELAVPDHSTPSRRAETLEVPRPWSNNPGSGPVYHLLWWAAPASSWAALANG